MAQVTRGTEGGRVGGVGVLAPVTMPSVLVLGKDLDPVTTLLLLVVAGQLALGNFSTTVHPFTVHRLPYHIPISNYNNLK